MCLQCYKNYGSPKILNDNIKQCAKLISKLYDWQCCGGNLHIVVDDWNIEDNDLKFCKNEIDKNKYNVPKGQIKIENLIYDYMIKMTILERASLLAYSDYGEEIFKEKF